MVEGTAAVSLRIAHPGRYGDLLWALPTARALAERAGEHVHLYLPTDPANTTPMGDFATLLEKQHDYISAVEIVPEWSIIQDAPRMPRAPHDRCLSLGYEGWPTEALPYEAARLGGVRALADDPHFFRPWIDVLPLDRSTDTRQHVLVHWTDRYFELKLGILHELRRALRHVNIEWYAGPGSRMADAGAIECNWLALARLMTGQQVVLTDCSAAHVLATAVGVRTVLVVEPEEARHHWIFWPGSDVAGAQPWLAKTTLLGRTIRPVLGNDGRPTFDSRHTIDAVRTALRS